MTRMRVSRTVGNDTSAKKTLNDNRNEKALRSSTGKHTKEAFEPQASAKEQQNPVRREFILPKKQSMRSDEEMTPKSSSKYRPAVGDIAKAFNKKASQLKQEKRRASLRIIDPDKKVRRKSSVKRLKKRRSSPSKAERDINKMNDDDRKRRATMHICEISETNAVK